MKLTNMNEKHSKFFSEPSKGNPAKQPLWRPSFLLNSQELLSADEITYHSGEKSLHLLGFS